MTKMNIKDIEFGNIDARHEILARSPDKRKLFLESFLAPTSFQISDIINGERFLIVGPKGSGKTAFLRYVSHTLDKSPNSKSRFIVFRDDVTDQDREKIATLSNFRIYDGEDDNDKNLIQDCSSAWQLFIHREISSLIQKETDICAKTPDVLDYIKLVNSFFSQFKTSSFKKFLQKITKGKIKIQGLGQGLEAEAEFVDSHGNVDISEFLRYCNSVLVGLNFSCERNNARLNIFFDEININYVSGKEFRRNSILIRDLVSACGIINLLAAENELPIYVYTAIRSDVVESVESSVRELKKWVDDKGVQLNWYKYGKRNADQPIIQLLSKRIEANELRLGVRKIGDKPLDLNDYFEPKIFNKPYESFLLFETWARPRDIVRLLTSAAKYVDRGKRFSEYSFTKSADQNSTDCWQEKIDELNSKYSQAAIGSLKRVLTGFKTKFSLSQLEQRITFLSKSDSRVKQFFDGRVLGTVLEDLYKVGVLGNMLKSRTGTYFPAYLYSGHSNFSLEEAFCVHRSLWAELQLQQTHPVKKGRG